MMMSGYLGGRIEFPQWLGKNSSRNKHDRILQELKTHLALRYVKDALRILIVKFTRCFFRFQDPMTLSYLCRRLFSKRIKLTCDAFLQIASTEKLHLELNQIRH